MTSSAVLERAPAAGRRLRTLARFATFAVVLAVSLGAVEGGLRLAGLPRSRELVVVRGEDPRGSESSPFYEPDPALLWKLKPSRVWDEFSMGFDDVRINARGLRGEDRDAEIVRSRLRVLCLGDSVTFGLALRDEDTYPARLEAALREASPDLAPVVVNAGVPGYSSVQGARLLERLASIRPDVIVWWFGMNDGKPALGSRDSMIETPVPLVPGRTGFLPALHTVRLAESLAADLRDSRTRVVPSEVRGIVGELEARSASGGPKVIYVRSPSRLGEKAAQLAALAQAVTARRVASVDGATDALSLYVPCSAAAAEIERVDVAGAAPVAVLRQGRYGRESVTTAELERRRDAAAAWRDAVDAAVAELPATALGYDHLFPGMSPERVFMDNCHLRAEGAKSAAAALARRIAELLGPSGSLR